MKVSELVKIPRHPAQEIPKGTFENIKKDAGI
ncbi:MAG: type II toxin-antitoxin system HicA family toxin [Lachnospiraceae bacterium]|nr:type II toxin-antitoxin system HicA family toxin [Lachnospiraceae bacterium]